MKLFQHLKLRQLQKTLPKLPNKVNWDFEKNSDETSLCDTRCPHKKFISSDGLITDNTPYATPGWHFCDKTNRVLRRPFGGTNNTIPFFKCGGTVVKTL